MPSERNVYRTLLDHLPGHVQRFEDRYQPGLPDLNVCYQGVETWVEVKVDKFKLRPGQALWMKKRQAAGGRCKVVVRTKGGWEIITATDWVGGPFTTVACRSTQEMVRQVMI